MKPRSVVVTRRRRAGQIREKLVARRVAVSICGRCGGSQLGTGHAVQQAIPDCPMTVSLVLHHGDVVDQATTLTAMRQGLPPRDGWRC